MNVEESVDLVMLATQLNEWGVRYLVIGGQALILHGIPLLTADIDVWIDPAVREEVLDWFENERGLEVPAQVPFPLPIVTIHAGFERIDLFFVRSMTNRDGLTLSFDDVIARRIVLADPSTGGIPIPSIDDLIALKRMGPKVRAKDEEGIRYLLALKLHEQSKSAARDDAGGSDPD